MNDSSKKCHYCDAMGVEVLSLPEEKNLKTGLTSYAFRWVCPKHLKKLKPIHDAAVSSAERAKKKRRR